MKQLLKKHIIILIFFNLTIIKFSFSQNSTINEGTIKIEASENIKQLIIKKRKYNKEKKYTLGYKIQIYYGSEKTAIKEKERFESVFNEVKTELKFNTPYWKVWVGNYKKRLEADAALEEIKAGFPSAIIVSSKVKI